MTKLSLSAVLREQLVSTHGQLGQLMDGVTGEQAHWAPPGKSHPVGALYAHILLYEDLILRFLIGDRRRSFWASGPGRWG